MILIGDFQTLNLIHTLNPRTQALCNVCVILYTVVMIVIEQQQYCKQSLSFGIILFQLFFVIFQLW